MFPKASFTRTNFSCVAEIDIIVSVTDKHPAETWVASFVRWVDFQIYIKSRIVSRILKPVTTPEITCALSKSGMW